MNIGKGLSGILAIGSISAPYVGLAFSTETALAAIPAGFAGVMGSIIAYAAADRQSELKRYSRRVAELYDADEKEIKERIRRLGMDEYTIFEHHLNNYDGRSLEELMQPDKEEVETYAKENKLPERTDYTINIMA